MAYPCSPALRSRPETSSGRQVPGSGGRGRDVSLRAEGASGRLAAWGRPLSPRARGLDPLQRHAAPLTVTAPDRPLAQRMSLGHHCSLAPRHPFPRLLDTGSASSSYAFRVAPVRAPSVLELYYSMGKINSDVRMIALFTLVTTSLQVLSGSPARRSRVLLNMSTPCHQLLPRPPHPRTSLPLLPAPAPH